MLDGELEPIAGIKVVDLGLRLPPAWHAASLAAVHCPPSRRCRRHRQAGRSDRRAVRYLGPASGEKILRSEYDGWIMGRLHGIVHYDGAELCGMGVRDDLPTVLPYPKGYFKA